jgi:hypothetical protein
MYIKPSIQIEEALAAQVLAESLIISDKVVNGSDALTKEDDAWDIWGEE